MRVTDTDIYLVDRNGVEFTVGDDVTYWSFNDKGDKDWCPAKVMAISIDQTSDWRGGPCKMKVKAVVRKTGNQKYHNAGQITKFSNIQKVV